MDSEKRKIVQSLFIPATLLLVMWLIKIFEWQSGISLANLGLRPLAASGLLGIITTPFLHADFNHLFSNSVPFLFLGAMLYYFYKEVANTVLILSWLFTGLLVWLMARQSIHIGASGVVYALATFHFTSGLIRRNPGLMAVTLLITFLYGGMVWGIFPQFFPGQNISWESHMAGMISGVIFAIWFRKTGPQKPEYIWEEEDDDNDLTNLANPGQTDQTTTTTFHDGFSSESTST